VRAYKIKYSIPSFLCIRCGVEVVSKRLSLPRHLTPKRKKALAQIARIQRHRAKDKVPAYVEAALESEIAGFIGKHKLPSHG